ncbi:hypothetical protein CYMTET_8882 [Cymbomonas tetramitiformis]|uniref:Uncharacterized protein n=1 Tax=Cymbomonas tetramitiformis TaxID=36881 RepID=A0AAE0LG22_9CHLO|nr:hypothetical protein CYMTET_8882 [Cymbomonas tetramitiformis]
MAQKKLDDWDKVLAVEADEEAEEEKVLKDIEQLRQEQSRDGLPSVERAKQFDTLADLNKKNGKFIAANLFREEAIEIRRVQRRADASAQARADKEREEKEKEDARQNKIREIARALKLSDEETDKIIKEKKQDEEARKKAAAQGDEWGSGWKKKGGGDAGLAPRGGFFGFIFRWLRSLFFRSPVLQAT